MAHRLRNHLPALLGTGLMLGLLSTACGESMADEHGGGGLDDPRGGVQSGLFRAQSCDDLLGKLQTDAIRKVELEKARALANYWDPTQVRDAGSGVPRGPVDEFPSEPDFAGSDGDSSDDGLSFAPPTTESPRPAPGAVGQDSNAGGEAGGDADKGPTGASDTNTQVAGVDEADFVKVVKMGEAMFVLHGSTLLKVNTWPAAESSLSPSKLVIEGSAQEMFVTDAGKAVVFSTVNGYGGTVQSGAGDVPVEVDGRPPSFAPASVACLPVDIDTGGLVGNDVYYGGCGGYYQPFTKITVIDVAGAEFKAERELYYEGSYLSSRRYDDVVRVVLQAEAHYQFLQPVDSYDYQTQRYLTRAEFEARLEERVEAAEAAIRKQTIQDWLPSIQEAVAGKLSDVAPNCADFYVPVAGTAGYGLTHVLSLDLAHGNQIGGVTIMGSAQTVYSNLDSLVLAQPDYRWGPAVDFGFMDEQQLNVHLFSIQGARTDYQASGSVSGNLPLHNPQFGIDVQGGVIRLATTGRKRVTPKADQSSPEFWNTTTTNQIYTMGQRGKVLTVLGKSVNLGHEGESVQSARFVGNRGYVVTFRQTDPLVVLDLKNPAAPTVLGEIEIPGFSQYMHPLDENHLITFGVSGSWGVQLQLFDVTDPAKSIPPPKVFDFGDGSSSEAQYNHKALTYFAEQDLLALPLYSYGNGYSASFSSTLELVKVDAAEGFTRVGAVDHAGLYEEQNSSCVNCYDGYCEYSCYNHYQPEVRRGHFVTSDDTTYVYSFSYAGVIVNDLANLGENLASIPFPAPTYDYTSWYGITGSSGGGVGEGEVDPAPDAGSSGVTPIDGGAAALDAGAAPTLEG